MHLKKNVLCVLASKLKVFVMYCGLRAKICLILSTTYYNSLLSAYERTENISDPKKHAISV